MRPQQNQSKPDHLAPEAEFAVRTPRGELEAQLLTVGRLLYQERINNDLLKRQLTAKTFDYDAYQFQKQQFDSLTAFIFHRYQREILDGQHLGKSLREIVEKYLGIERGRLQVRIANWWWRLTGKEGD